MSNLASEMNRLSSIQAKARSKSGKSTLIGKSEHQVHRRNERERRRVQQINNGYTVLARSVASWKECKNRNKLSKVETLRAAVKYIKHLEEVLTVSSSTVDSSSSKTYDYSPYMPQKVEKSDPAIDSMGFNFPNSCYSQGYEPRLSASTTSICSSGYDSAYASPNYGQSFSHSQMLMNMPSQFYGMPHHDNLHSMGR